MVSRKPFWVIVDLFEYATRDERFHRSHAAKDGHLGAGMIYYMAAYLFRPRLCVCLGSGSGFVPRLMRQAQKDAGVEGAQTILVDADVPGYGVADYHDRDTFFTRQCDVEVRKKLTRDAVGDFGVQSIGYLHIDADHLYEAVKWDFENYLPLVEDGRGIITLHDTIPRKVGVWKVIKEIAERTDLQVLDIPIGMGTAMIMKQRSV